ncbi:MAG TPA: aminotransferase class I/II-fold pyridoxal phosphate-dependent enzyme [Longimicrobiales bacterium]
MKRAIKAFARLHGWAIHRRFLIRTPGWPEERRTAYIRERLKATLVRAYEGTRYYREAFDAVGFDPRVDFRGPEDLAALPILTKDRIRADADALVDPRFRRFSIEASTSGTTGEPLRMRLNEGFVAFDTGCIFRHWSWAGYRWRDRMVALRSYVPASDREPLWRFDRPQNTLFFSAYHLSPATCEAYIERMLDFQPRFIKGYPSSVTVLAEYAYPVRDRFRALRGIFTSSETLLPTERETIERTFGRKVFNWYGMTEPALVLTECEAHEGMHVNWEYGHPEFLPSDDLPTGEYRLVATGFHNPVMPFIRYETGDVVRLLDGDAPCACGRNLPRVETVVGRKDECIITPDGRRLPSVNFYTVFRKYAEVLRFQLVQYGRGEVVAKIAPRAGVRGLDGVREKIAEELRARIGPAVTLDIEVTDRFVTNADGKAPPIVRRIGSRAVEEREAYRISTQQAWGAARRGEATHKLDWNEADRVPSPKVREALHRLIDRDPYLCWYPEAATTEAEARIAEYAGVPVDHVLLVHGSDAGLELIARALVREGDRVLIVSPTYDNFRAVVEQRGAEPVFFDYRGTGDFPLVALVDRIGGDAPRIVYLTHPNNPIGYVLPRPALDRILRQCERVGAVLVVDEAYHEFCGETIADAATTSSTLLVARTFSKAFGLAGLRLGYLVGSRPVLDALRRVHNPKSVTMLAKAAAAAALEDLPALRGYVEEVRGARARVCAFLAERGIEHYPSEANFVLVRWDDAPALVRFLAARNILVRDRSAYFDGAGHVRITVNGMPAAEAVMGALRAYLEAVASSGGPASAASAPRPRAGAAAQDAAASSASPAEPAVPSGTAERPRRSTS